MDKLIDINGLNTYYNGVKGALLPEGGTLNQVLLSNSNNPQWKNLNEIVDYEQLLAYGVEWTTNQVDPHLTRVGNMSYHKTLPIQSQMKGCIYQPKNKKLMYWLDENNWRYKKGYKDIRGENYTENLLLNSDVVTENSSYNIATYQIADYIYEGTPFTITIWGQLGSEDYQFIAHNSGAEINIAALTKKSEGVYSAVGTWERTKPGNSTIANNTYVSIYVFPYGQTPEFSSKINKIKLEVGYNSNPVWTKAESETDDSILARLDGYDGEVMVHVPEFWIKSWDTEDKKRVMISPVKVDDSWQHQPEIYVGAYACTYVQNAPSDMGYLSTLSNNKYMSISNKNTYCRGRTFFGDSTDFDKYLTGADSAIIDPLRSSLNKPDLDRTFIFARNAAKASGTVLLNYNQYKNIFYWLYVIEYANFKFHEDFTEELTAEGYHQGGIGTGIYNLADINSGYNNMGVYTPNGCGNDLGNRTGVKNLIIQKTAINESTIIPKRTITMNRWRGFDNPFSENRIGLEGILVEVVSGKPSSVYITDNPENYSDSLTNKTYLCDIYPEGMSNQTMSVTEYNLGYSAEIIPKTGLMESGNVSNKYKCYTSYVPGMLQNGVNVNIHCNNRTSSPNLYLFLDNASMTYFSAYRTVCPA